MLATFPTLRSQLQRLEELRGSRALLLAYADRPPFPKTLGEEDLPALYDGLAALGKVERLNLVLHCIGGRVTVSRRFYTLLKHYAKELTIFVPRKARSAATLLCLGANELVMTPLAELGPLDPHISAANAGPGPAVLSSEDIQAYRAVAEEWFGLEAEAHRMELFKLLTERIFPTTLSHFYRADKQMRQFASELLGVQLPDAALARREAMVEHLVSGYFEHDYPISYQEAAELGLAARPTSGDEESILAAIHLEYSGAFQQDRAEVGAPQPLLREQYVNGLILSTDYEAQHLTTVEQMSSPAPSANHAPHTTITYREEGRWHAVGVDQTQEAASKQTVLEREAGR